MKPSNVSSISLLLLVIVIQGSRAENSYLKHIKDGCVSRGEALSCMKYKALKVATKTIFGYGKNETIKANNLISFVILEPELVMPVVKEEFVEPRGFMSEWSELTKYWMELIQQFVLRRGLKVELPEGATTEIVEAATGRTDDEARGKRKRLAVILPLLSLLAALKTKVLLIPVLLAVVFIKKLLLVAALLVPSLLSTLKACKIPHPPHHYSHYSSDMAGSEFSSAGYGGGYSYTGGGPGPAYSKDWAASRAYAIPKRAPPAIYATAPGVQDRLS